MPSLFERAVEILNTEEHDGKIDSRLTTVFGPRFLYQGTRRPIASFHEEVIKLNELDTLAEAVNKADFCDGFYVALVPPYASLAALRSSEEAKKALDKIVVNHHLGSVGYKVEIVTTNPLKVKIPKLIGFPSEVLSATDLTPTLQMFDSSIVFFENCLEFRMKTEAVPEELDLMSRVCEDIYLIDPIQLQKNLKEYEKRRRR